MEVARRPKLFRRWITLGMLAAVALTLYFARESLVTLVHVYRLRQDPALLDEFARAAEECDDINVRRAIELATKDITEKE